MRTPSPWLKYALGGVVIGVLLVAGSALGMRITDSRPFCASSCSRIRPTLPPTRG